MSAPYKVVEEPIPAGDYLRLREQVGWWRVDPTLVARSLAESLYSVVVTDEEGEVVGFGRLVGDPMYMYVQDMIVAEAHRGRGLGERLMNHILDFAASAAQPGSYLGLMCARGVEPFYRKFGFEPRPADGPGMQRVFR